MKKLWSEIKERLSNENITDTWKKVRNVSGVVCATGGLILAMPVTLPVIVTSWVGWITLASSVIAGRAHLNTGKKNVSKDKNKP